MNTSISLGGIVMIQKIEKDFALFKTIFDRLEGNMKDFIALVKFLTYNKLTRSVSINQILEIYPKEVMEKLGTKEEHSERTLYRTLERIGKQFPIILQRYQDFIKENNLISKEQFIDFSSTYLDIIEELVLGYI